MVGIHARGNGIMAIASALPCNYRLDIILVKGLSKHTLSTYFLGMKVCPKYAFLHAFLFVHHVLSRICNHDQKHTLFSSFFQDFAPPKRCTRVHCLVLKNNPNYVNFLRGWYPTSNTSAPRGSLPINLRNKWTLLNRKVSSHFVRAKQYQYHINLYQHLMANLMPRF